MMRLPSSACVTAKLWLQNCGASSPQDAWDICYRPDWMAWYVAYMDQSLATLQKLQSLVSQWEPVEDMIWRESFLLATTPDYNYANDAALAFMVPGDWDAKYAKEFREAFPRVPGPVDPRVSLDDPEVRVRIIHDECCPSPLDEYNEVEVYALSRDGNRLATGTEWKFVDKILALTPIEDLRSHCTSAEIKETASTMVIGTVDPRSVYEEVIRGKYDLLELIREVGIPDEIPAVAIHISSGSTKDRTGIVSYRYDRSCADMLFSSQSLSQEQLESFVEEYCTWAEGDCWSYVVESRCSCCGEWTYDDSCGGFIGTDWETNGMADTCPINIDWSKISYEHLEYRR